MEGESVVRVGCLIMVSETRFGKWERKSRSCENGEGAASEAGGERSEPREGWAKLCERGGER